MKHSALVTGADGFLGKNLVHQLRVEGDFEILEFNRQTDVNTLEHMLDRCTVVLHMAGSNRPEDSSRFQRDNVDLTSEILYRLEAKSPKPIVLASSRHAGNGTPYGQSKLMAEKLVRDFSSRHGVRCRILRLPNVFGKWSKPNYNSVVATFAHNVSRGIPLRVDDPCKTIELVYIDDVVRAVKRDIRDGLCEPVLTVEPIYRTTVGALAATMTNFHDTRTEKLVLDVGTGFLRALYATYIAALEPAQFTYPLSENRDHRGTFIEFLKTPTAGQISFLTAKPGVTRGSHVHHTKVEKFVVVQGSARFRFRNIVNDESYVVKVGSDEPVVIESIPGWAHDITNIGSITLIILVWASESFDRTNPDTVGVDFNDTES